MAKTSVLAACQEALNRIASDNTSGAAEILRQAGVAFTHLNAASLIGADAAQAKRAVLELCIALASAQPEMTPILRLASVTISAARMANNAQDPLKWAQEAALDFIANAARAAADSSMHSAALIQDGASVLTHSRSSTVLAALVDARRAGKNFSVVVTESRPMLEGRFVAAALASEDIPVTLIADAAAALAMDEVDLVMTGADTVMPTSLVNKIGTRLIALAARAAALPLFAVCDSSKFICEDYSLGEIRGSRDPDELWTEAPQKVSVVNRYFESTPLNSFSGIVTEDGLLSITEAVRRAENAAIDIAFADALRNR